MSTNNWHHQNVRKWVHDAPLLELAKECLRMSRHTSWYKAGQSRRDAAARCMLEQLADRGLRATPDGAVYTFTTVRAAMKDIELTLRKP